VLAELITTRGVVEQSTLRGAVGVMALHGGLEDGTAFAARECSRIAGASLYVVEQPEDFRWHVPSTRFDPLESRRLSRFLEHVKVAVSIHGFGRPGFERAVLVGGGNRRLRELIGSAIGRRTDLDVITDLDRIPPELRGTHPRNPVNLPEFGGVQIELSPHARGEHELSRTIAAVASVIVAEQAGVCAAP
jgi:phage replication-related protein YjqB (UPF0714/DUF867 family)